MFKNYFSMLKKEFSGYSLNKFSKDVLAGLTVTAVALPLALAFGESCGASAAAGLVTAIIAGLIIGALSGGSFQISGPTGAMSAILMGIVAKEGLSSVFMVSFFAGVIILLCAVLKLGKLVQMIPRPVVTGFTSGIAIIIALGQIDNFFGTSSVGASALEKLSSYSHLGFKPNIHAVILGLIVIAVMIIWPKKWNAVIPSSLIGICVSTVVCVSLGLDADKVGEIPKTLFLSQRLTFDGFDFSKIGAYISPAFSIAALGIIESLMCGASAKRMKNDDFDADTELVAQGIGNIIIPFFGGVPATAAIARTSVAIKSGCQTRVTGIVHALGLLASMFLLGPVMAQIPLSALAGVLMVTAFRMNEWSEIRYFFGKRFYGASAKFLITMLATVIFDLTVAIIIGIVFSMILFVLNSSKMTCQFSKIDNVSVENESELESTYALYITGPIFFMNSEKLEKFSRKTPDNCKTLIISFRGVPAVDTTGVETVSEIIKELRNNNIRVKVCGLAENPETMLHRGGVLQEIGAENVFETINKALI